MATFYTFLHFRPLAANESRLHRQLATRVATASSSAHVALDRAHRTSKGIRTEPRWRQAPFGPVYCERPICTICAAGRPGQRAKCAANMEIRLGDLRREVSHTDERRPRESRRADSVRGPLLRHHRRRRAAAG